MANVRSRFDAIAEYLAKAHGARVFHVRSRLCLGIEGATFMAFHREGIGFRLDGRTFDYALNLIGARTWHPIDPNRVAPGWVFVPSVHAWRYERLAVESLRFARRVRLLRRLGVITDQSRGSGAAIASRPPSTPQSLAARFQAAIARSFPGLNLARAA